MSIEDDITLLASVPIFAPLGREALRIVVIGAESRYVHEGDVLFHEGEAADAGYVVQEGAFRLESKRLAPGLEPVTIGRGALLGELALLTETVRPATATASAPSSVMQIPRKLFLKMLEGYPVAARRLRDLVARRAAETLQEVAHARRIFDPGEDAR